MTEPPPTTDPDPTGAEPRGSHLVDLTRYAWLSIAAAVVTILMKSVAAVVTGSVGLLSDAAESVVNLAAAGGALWALHLANRPADPEHAYGFGKSEYLAASFEGALILVAAGGITWTAVDRLINPQGIEEIGIGMAVSVAAALVNLGVALVLLRAGRRHRSITLEADARHLLTDVWTSAGVVVGVFLAWLTGLDRLDAVVAIAVAVNIVVSGFVLLRRSARGLLDAAVPPDDLESIQEVLERYRSAAVDVHALRTRQAGRRSFASFHVLVPGAWTVKEGHDLLERLEADLRRRVPGLTVEAHLEPLEDPASYADVELDRGTLPPSVRHRTDAPGADGPTA